MARARKALLAAAGAFVTAAVATAVQAGGWPGWPALGTALGVAVAAGLAVYRTPNAPA